MTTNAERATTLARALRSRFELGASVPDFYTDDVTVWTPSFTAGSVGEMLAAVAGLDASFSDAELVLSPLDVSGDVACVEWSLSITHTGPLSLGDGITVEPRGIRVTIHGVTVAEFEGERICSLRQYWDEMSVLEQLGLLPEPASGRR